MAAFYIMADNWADSSIAASESVSSAQTLFPRTNLYDQYRRTKTWRSTGYWDLSAGTASIIFQETAGVNLTALLAASVYYSDTTFLAAIQTALNAAGGVGTYTATRDSTSNKIILTQSVSGGASVFRLEFQTSTFMGGILGYDAVELTGATAYTADDLRIHTSEWIKWDFGTPSNPKAFVFIADRNSNLIISPGSTIYLQGNSTDSWSSPEYNQALTFDDYVLWQFSSTGLHTSELRFWRFSIVDYENPLGYVECGSVYLGDALVPERGAVQFGFQTQYIDRSPTLFSEAGQDFTNNFPKTDSFNLDFKFLTYGDMENVQDIWSRCGLGVPFYISLDTGAVYSSAANRWVRYVKFAQPPSHSLDSPNNFSVSLSLREVL